MDNILRVKWTEPQIRALPEGEHNYFDRKKSDFLADNDFPKDLAKAVSAFANSGGGHIIIGVKDDSIIEGVSKTYSGKKGKGRQSTREWLEQIIPNLVTYPLRDFRVHSVAISSLPKDKVVIIIDIGDSKLAPHQTNTKNDTKLYYQRVGGHSVQAEHHNIALMFGRSRFPSKEVAASWLEKVINPLISHLNYESQNLKEKRRAWDCERKYLRLTYHESYQLIGDGKLNFLSYEILEQLIEFTPNLFALIKKHDEIVRKIDSQSLNFYKELIKSNDLKSHFRNVTTTEKLQEIAQSDYDLSSYQPDQLYKRIIGFDNDKKRALEFIAILIINRIRKWNGSTTFSIFWDKEWKDFTALVKRSALLSHDLQIDKSYSDCCKVNKKLVEILKEKRKMISIEFGIPLI